MPQKSTLTQQQLLRQRLLPQQLRLVSLLEAPTEQVEQEILAELDENPALERVNPDEESRYGGGTARSGYVASSGGDSNDFQPQIADAEPTLGEYLAEQLAEQDGLSAGSRMAAAYMIGALDSNGYLTRTLPQLIIDIEIASEETALKPLESEVRTAYDALRGLEPAGVGAQDLRDCLILQLRRLDGEREAVRDALEITIHFFDLYSRRNNRKLSEYSGLSQERIAAAHEVITSLNPKPGAPFASDPTQAMGNAAVTPDFMVETDGEQLTVSMINSLPELQIEESFRADAPGSDAAAKFVRERRLRAESFIDVLKRRTQTLMIIARAIVQYQAPFFQNGDDESRIRPMVLRQIADSTGLDITMISRAVSGKWLATQWGVYSLKSFFNHRSGADDEETSAREIDAAIREIIAAESTDSPLSDEAIAAALGERGYKVARRTVAKYRTRLGIPSARLRGK